MESYEDLTYEAKYLLKQYLQESVNRQFGRTELTGLVKSNYNALKMLESLSPGKKAVFCWTCGEIDLVSENYDFEANGWTLNDHVVHSGRLCSKCSSDPKKKAYFLNDDRNIDAVAKRIAEFGIWAFEEFRGREAGWGNKSPEAAQEAEDARERAQRMVKNAWDDGNPYGTNPDKIDK